MGMGTMPPTPQQVPLGVWGLWEPHFLLKINMGSGGDPIPRGRGLKCGVVFSLGMLIPALLPPGPLCPRGKTEPWEQPLCAPRSRGVGILEIFAVSQGIVGIRGVFSNKFLAMSKKGKLHASAHFTSECQFRERFQENSYNTYASAVHRGRRSGREWYVALNKRGKAKRGCSPRARPQHVSTHFLPRFRQPPPPQLAFTVTRPEKKPPPPPPPPPPKKTAAATPPRHSHGPVKYRLKFRFG
eukprot:XP_027312786.1 fibroblast growth factor 5 isoform X2 [Anas platyrhynchos]